MNVANDECLLTNIDTPGSGGPTQKVVRHMHTPTRSVDVDYSTTTHAHQPRTGQRPDGPAKRTTTGGESCDNQPPSAISPATSHHAPADRDRADPASFAGRLNRLFNTIRPPGRGPLRDAEARRELETRGHQMSAPYLSQLRSGARTNPHPKTIRHLADLFGVRPEYFTGEDPDYTALIDAELQWLALAHDPDVRRIVSGLLELRPAGREGILRAIESGNASPLSG